MTTSRSEFLHGVRDELPILFGVLPVFIGKMQILPIMQQGLRFVPIAVLSALIAPALFFPAGTLNISLSNARLIAGILAILVAWRTKNVLLTIFVGMACLLILQVFVR